MFGRYSGKCFYTWLSGFFFAPAFFQFMKVMMGWSMMIGSWQVTTTCSMMIIAAGLLLSFFFCWMAKKKCCGDESCG